MIGKIFTVSGMQIEIIADAGDNWKTRNITTAETILFDKAMLDKAIRLGMAEEITNPADKG